MPKKFKREGYRERAELLGRTQFRLFGGGGGKPTHIGPMRGRRLLMYAIPAMVLLILAGHFLEPALQRHSEPLEEKEGVVFAKRSFDEGMPDEEYLLGVRVTLDDGRTIEDVFSVEAEFWRRVNEGDPVTVRYKCNKKSGAVDLRMVVLPEETP